MTKQCSECHRTLPTEKFNQESDAPDVCFGCRVKTVNIGFGGNRESWHGDALVGGTIASDNRHTIAEAKSNGYNPVPVSTGPTHGLTSGQMERLKSALR